MNIALKYGMSAGIIIAIWNILNYFYLYNTPLSRITFFVNLLLFLVMLFLGIKSYKKNKFSNKITFANAGLSGILITFAASITLSILTFFYTGIKNTPYEDYYIKETKVQMEKRQMKDAEKTLKELKIAFVPINQAKSSFMITLIVGIVFSFVFAMVLRNSVHENSGRV